MSIARHHNEWLSLLEVSGPFLSLPVLLRGFPQGLDALDKDRSAEARLAYEEWVENQSGLRPEPAIHSVWVRYVLERLLGFDKTSLLEGPAIPTHLKAEIAEHGETLRPDLVVSPIPSPLSPSGDRGARLLIQIYPSGQKLESPLHDRRWKASPAMRMMELLRATGVPLGLATNGEQWMLVHTPRGGITSFISWYASLWFEEPLTLRAFTSLLGAGRFFGVADEDTLEAMLRLSADQQQEVTDQLGYQVRRAVEVLIRALDKADQDQGRLLLVGIRESDLYEAALTVMMRLVFLFSAEERGLLLLGDPVYDQNYAVSTLRAQLRETADQQGEEVLERRFDAWCRLIAAFRAVHGGIQHDRLHLPAYGGSLFDPDKYPFLEGRATVEGSRLKVESSDANLQPSTFDLQPLPINNRTVLHLLESLQILRVKVPGGGPAEARRLSFRALDVEQIGHVYEGLLDHITLRAGEIVLGLSGTREKEPEIPMSELQGKGESGEGALIEFLKDQTGRSASALKKALQAEPDAFASGRLKIACNNDESVYKQVLPYWGLLRADDFGYLTVFLAGSVYMTAGVTRRATGTHYTPRSLTEPIVQHTLEPLVYLGPAEGLPREEWKLRSPAELLELKVCDPAMGSAGFLVQVVRYLSERLVEAWENVEQGIGEKGKGESASSPTPLSPIPRITPEGRLSTGAPGETLIPSDDEERLILARRLVADRCIYGVDKNPLAVEIAKLSIWLTTMDKGRPFSFLDHALKCGDSLVGASADEFLRWARGWRAAEATLFDATLEEQLETARQKRRELETFEVLDVRDAERKADLLAEADAALKRVKCGCDLLVGARLLGLSEKDAEELQLKLLFPYMAGDEEKNQFARAPLDAADKVHAFHWEFEYPEVFVRGGFSAFVGNPPFLGGQKITGALGTNYREYLICNISGNNRGSADLCVYFFLRVTQLLSNISTVGFIATNSIAQGVTRDIGLERMVSNGFQIYRAIQSIKWPGDANLQVAIVFFTKIRWDGEFCLNGAANSGQITSFLTRSNEVSGTPFILAENAKKSFMGTTVLGTGFILSLDIAEALIAKDERNKDVLFPYINGYDLYSQPDQYPTRWIINFHEWDLKRAVAYVDCMKIVQESVKPQRDSITYSKTARENWWQFERVRPALYQIIAHQRRVLVKAQVSSTWAWAFVPNGWVYDAKLLVFAFERYLEFAILQCTFHWIWSLLYGTTLKTDLSYTPTTNFQTYPFPKSTSIIMTSLDTTGKTYYEHRCQIMLTRQEGLTTTYNRFHNPKEKATDIACLRALHVDMDNAVAAAYGWSDLDLMHGFRETPQGVRYTISEAARREVLARLLKLNHERYEEEVRQGLHEKKGKGRRAKGEKGARSGQGGSGGSRQAIKSAVPGKSSLSETSKSRTSAKSKADHLLAASQPKLELFQSQDEDQPLTVLTRLPFMGLQGNIYRCPMPYGAHDPEGRGLVEMKRKKVSVVVILASDQEAHQKAGRDLRKLYQAKGFEVIHLPIPDFGVPEREALNKAVQKTTDLARQGKNIAVHCSAGVGRTGLFMAEVAKQAMKMTGQSALYWVRLYIDGAVETEEQERFVKEEE